MSKKFFNVSLIMLTIIASFILYGSILFLLGFSISPYSLLMSLLLAGIFIHYFFTEMLLKDKLYYFLFAICIIVLTALLCGLSYDFSYDGNAYHKLAVGNLANGWNPVRQNTFDYLKFTQYDFNGYFPWGDGIWIEHYPKATWIYSAILYAFLKNIEMCKNLTWLLMFICFFQFYDYLNKKNFNMKTAFIFSLLFAANPISIAQCTSFYVDGILANLLSIILLDLFILTDPTYPDKKKYILLSLGISIIICVNVKFTGLAYSGIFCLGYFIMWCIFGFHNKEYRKIVHILLFYIFIVFCSLFIVGFSSYIKNLLDHGNPLYPLIGKDKVDIISSFRPDTFNGLNPYTQFGLMTLSQTQNENKSEVKVKIPFSVHKEELNSCYLDTRRGGFGVFFSGLFCMAIFFYIYLLPKIYHHKKLIFYQMLLCLSLSILLVGLIEGSWWARYSPYIYIMTLTVYVFLLRIHKNRYVKILCSFLLFLFVCNNLIFTRYIVKDYVQSKEVRNLMGNLSNVTDIKCKIELAGIYYNLLDEHFSFRLYQDIDEPNLEVFYGLKIQPPGEQAVD